MIDLYSGQNDLADPYNISKAKKVTPGRTLGMKGYTVNLDDLSSNVDPSMYDMWEGFDWLVNKYPNFKDYIMTARSKGIRDDIIDKFFDQEILPRFNFAAKPDIVKQVIGRTPETEEMGRKFALAKRFQAFKTAFPKKSDQDITNAIWLEQDSGISANVILNNPELAKSIVGGRLLNYKWTGSQEDLDNIPDWRTAGKWDAIKGAANYFFPKTSPLRIGFHNYSNLRDIASVGTNLLYNRIGRDEAFKREQELSQNYYSEPVVKDGVNSAIQEAAKILAQGYSTGGKSLVAGGIGAAVGEGLRKLGMPMPAPAANYRIAASIATMNELWELGAGLAMLEYSKMVDDDGNPIDINAARTAAMLNGGITVAVEMAGLKAVAKMFPGLSKMLGTVDSGVTKEAIIDALQHNPAVREAFSEAGKNYVEGVSISTFNNLVETISETLGMPLAQYISGKNFSKWNAQNPLNLKQKSIETIETSIAGFGVSMLPGLIKGINTVTQVGENVTKLINQYAYENGITYQEALEKVAQEIYNAKQSQELPEQGQEQSQEQPATDQDEQTAPTPQTETSELPQDLPQTQPTQEDLPAQELPVQEELPAPQTDAQETTTQGQPQEQTAPADNTETINAEFVYLPANDLQAYLAENDGIDIQEAFEAGDEVGMPREQYEKLKAEHQEFTNTVLSKTRFGAENPTIEEAARLADKTSVQAVFTPEVQEVIKQQEENYINAGANPEDAATLSTILAMIGGHVEAVYGETISPIEIKTSEEVEAERLAEQNSQNDMSRLQDETYDVAHPPSWTNKQRFANLLKAAQEGKIKNLTLFTKRLLELTGGLKGMAGVDADDTNAPMEAIIRDEVKDYQRTLKVANQDAIDFISKRTDLDTERYEINAKFPRGKGNKPDHRVIISNSEGDTIYSGEVIVDFAEKNDNLYVKVKREGVRETFTFAIKNFWDANLEQVIKDLTEGVTTKSVEMSRTPVMKSIVEALNDFWSEYLYSPAVNENTATVEETSPAPQNVIAAAETPNEEISPEVVTPESDIETPEDVPVRGMSDAAETNLLTDQDELETALSAYLKGEPVSYGSLKQIKIMRRTPLVLTLAGVDLNSPVVIFEKKINATKDAIFNKHGESITQEHIANIPFYLSDPIAVFRSSPDSKSPDGSLVVLTEAKDKNGASIIIPIHPNSPVRKGAGELFTRVASMYAQADKDGKPKNDWFKTQVDEGRLLYIDTEKAAQWTKDTGVQLLPEDGTIPEGAKTRDDLVNLWQVHGKAGYFKSGPNEERLSRINILGFGKALVELFSMSGNKALNIHIHDIGHAMFGIIDGLAEAGYSQMLSDRDYILGRAGVTLEQWLAETPNQRGGARETAHEWFANAFEAYIFEGGKSSVPALQAVLDRAKDELIRIYQDIQQIGITLNEQDRELFDRLLSIPGRDSNTIAEFAVQNDNISTNIDTMRRELAVIEEQRQKDIAANNKAVNDTLPVELDDDTISSVENYAAMDSDFSQAGNRAMVITSRGTEVENRYRLVEAADLITSHNDMGDINPDFPSELQPRDRSRAASRKQINRMAGNIDPESLGASRNAATGAPIIGSDNIVESGNGRILALMQAYNNGKAQKYRNWIISNAETFGVSQEDAKNFSQPVLVRERLTDVDRAVFAAEANEANIASMSASVSAFNDAKNLSNEILRLFDISKPLHDNTDFINSFSKIIPEADLDMFTKSNGEISRQGLERIVYTLTAKAYDNADILERISESYDNNMRNISNALVAAAPSIALLQNSNYSEELFIGKDIAQAVQLLDRLRQDGISVQEFISQPEIFSNETSDDAKTILQFLDRNKGSYKRLVAGIINYVNAAMNEAQIGQGLIFEDSARGKSAILDEAFRHAESAELSSSAIQEPISSTLFEKVNDNGKVEPTIPVNHNTFAAFMAEFGPEGAIHYLKKRQKYLKSKKGKVNAEAELARIEHYISQINDTFSEELKAKKGTTITKKDLRAKFNEGIKEGRTREKTKQAGIQAEIDAEHQKEIQDINADHEADIEQLKAQHEADEENAYKREITAEQKWEAELADREAELNEQHDQEMAVLMAEQEKQRAEMEEKHSAEMLKVKEKDSEKIAAREEKHKLAMSELREKQKQEKAELREKAKVKYSEEKQRWAEQRQKLIERSQAKLDKKDASSQRKIDKLQRRIQRMSETSKQLKKRINLRQTIKRIMSMRKSPSISWNRHEEIEEYIKTLDFDRSKKGIERRELLQRFMDSDNVAEIQAINEEAGGITQEEMNEFMGKIHLADLTLGELKDLVSVIQSIYRQGRQEFEVWKAERQARRDNIMNKLAEAINTKFPAPKERVPKSGEDLSHKYKLGNVGDVANKYWLDGMTPGRFLEMLGEPFRETLGDDVNIRTNRIYQNIFDRLNFVTEELKKVGLTPEQLGNFATTIDGQEYTWQNVMKIFAAFQGGQDGKGNQFAQNAILYGNFLSNTAERYTPYHTVEDAMDAINKILAFINQPENLKYKQGANVFLQDFQNNVQRVKEAQIKGFNRGFDEQQNYDVMFRLRHQTSGGFQINTETEELARNGDYDKLFHKVADGFTQPRMEINPERQQPISLNMFGDWYKAIYEQEYRTELGVWAADMFSALTTTTTEHESIQQMIEERLGTNAWDLLKEIYNNSINSTTSLEADAADKIARWLMTARSFAYVAYNPVSIIAQSTSYFLALPYTNHNHLFRSLAKFIEMGATGRGKEFLENVYQKYPELRYSAGDPYMKTISNMKKYGEYREWNAKYYEYAYKGTAVMDRWTKAIVFDAVYNSEKENGKSELDAVRLAIRAVQDTQPASSAREMTAFNRGKGATKLLFFQFMNALAPIYNAAVVDVARNIASKDWNHIQAAAWTMLGVGLSLGFGGLIKGALQGRLPTGKERDDGGTDNWWRWLVDTEIENLFNTAPLIGSALIEWYRRARRNKSYRSDNRVTEPFEAAGKAVSSIGSDDGFDFDSAFKAAALFGVPIPYSGIKNLFRWLGLTEDKEE